MFRQGEKMAVDQLTDDSWQLADGSKTFFPQT
jgi:hypothetical protein